MVANTKTNTSTHKSAQAVPAELDLITAEVIRAAYDNITAEMSLVLLRTSGSPVLTESKDFSTVFFDADLNQIGTSGYVLIHMSSSRLGVEAIAAQRLPNDIEPGDAFICNDPHTSGACHQGDVGVIMPVFYSDQLVGWTFSNAHLMDVGGAAISGFAPEARDTYSEALRFPGTRIARNAVLDEEWVGFMRNNVRVPVSFISDLRSLVAACNIGGERYAGMVEEYGLATLKAYTLFNIELTEKALRARIAGLPDGTYQTYDFVEYDGFGTSDLNPIFCELSVKGDQLKFSFSGCPQIAAFVNCGRSALEGNLMGAIMCQFAPDIPFNQGFWNCIEIDLGEPGTILNPVVPAPVTSGHASGGMRAARMGQEALIAACAASDDEYLLSRVSAQASSAVTLGVWFGADNKGNPSMFMPFGMTVGIGGPAQKFGDGQDGYGMQSTLAIKWSDVEVQELDAPVMMLWRRVGENVGGAGATRGGLSIDEAFMLYGADNFSGASFQSGAEIPARGYAGGMPGGNCKAWMFRNCDLEGSIAKGQMPSSPERLSGNIDTTLRSCQTNIPFGKGDVYRGVSSSSGGLGDPFLRAPELVEADLIDNAISLAAAEQLYGAVFSSHDPVTIDVDASWEHRNGIRAAMMPDANVELQKLPKDRAVLGVCHQGGLWACGRCDTELSGIGESWVGQAFTRYRDMADIFEAAGVNNRRREEIPVTLVEHYCPNCASCLAVQVTLNDEATTVYQFADDSVSTQSRATL